jgi:hypothetical protein
MHESKRIESEASTDEPLQSPGDPDQETTGLDAVDFYFWGIFDPE